MLTVVWLLWLMADVGATSASANGTDDEPDGLLVLKNQVPICAAAALTDNAEFVVTAAHCVFGVPNAGLSIFWAKNETKTKTLVKRVIVHPYYSPPSADYDIALLKTDKIMVTPELKSFKLMKVPPASDAALTAFSLKEEQLEEVHAVLEDRKSCRAKLGKHITVSARMLCANIPSGVVAEGSPLIADDAIIGTGSYYVKGTDENMPKVFTNFANSEIYSFVERYIG